MSNIEDRPVGSRSEPTALASSVLEARIDRIERALKDGLQDVGNDVTDLGDQVLAPRLDRIERRLDQIEKAL